MRGEKKGRKLKNWKGREDIFDEDYSATGFSHWEPH
jgi:hypothetical protein